MTTNTLANVQAQNGLWELLWKAALDEAYSARDAKRRMDEMQGLARDQVVEVYFGYHPAMRQWAEQHIKAGTCEAAIADLQETLEHTWELRKQQREQATQMQPGLAEELSEPEQDDSSWMDPFKAKPWSFGGATQPSSKSATADISPISPEPAPAPSTQLPTVPNPLPAFDFNKALAYVAGQKVLNLERPSREALAKELQKHFLSVSRDQAEGVLKQLKWKGKRGRKSSRPSSAN